MRIPSKIGWALRSGLLLALLSAPSEAQCFTGPDGLSGPCCSFVPANLPPFPPMSLPSTGICWNSCVPTQVCTQVGWTAPLPVSCGQYISNLSVIDCGPNLLLSGTLMLDYARTWEEVNPNPGGPSVQVYRFMAKVDMLLSGAPLPCVTPPCLGATPSAFYYGYMDYAVDCSSGTYEASLVLFHGCDRFIHHPLSTRPGAFHPATSFAIVAPSSSVNPFVATIIPAINGSMPVGGIRDAPFAGACLTEDRMSSAALTFIGAGCLCPVSFTPAQLTGRRFKGAGSCPSPSGVASAFLSLKTTPGLPWYHMMTTSIGNWTTFASYPGNEVVWVDEVPMVFKDSCVPSTGLPRNFGEVYYGASTAKGYPVVPAGGVVLTNNFIDMASNTSWPLPGPAPSTYMGSVLPTRNLIYGNLP